jgi:hypothetical protein
MKLKPLTLSVVVLAVLCLLAWSLTKPPRLTGTDPRVGQPLVSNETIKATAQLKLTENGKTVLLKKLPDDTWQVASYYDFPADFSKLASFIHDLTDAKIQRFVTANPERFARLEFKDSAIALLDTHGKELWSLTLGKTADSGGRFVHFDDEKRVYLTQLNAWIDSESHNWADSALLHLKPEDIAKVEISFPGSPAVTAHRTTATAAFKSDATPSGQQLKTDEITNLLSSLTALHFTDTTAKDDPAAKAAAAHERTLKLTTFGGESYAIALGRTPESKKLKTAKPETTPSKSDAKPDAPKPAKPAYETIPAGPVFVSVTSSNAKAAINEMMQKRAFKVADYAFTSLPQTAADLFESLPAASSPTSSSKTAAPKDIKSSSPAPTASRAKPVPAAG